MSNDTEQPSYPTQEAGQLVHFIETGMTVRFGSSVGATSRVMARGDEVLLTEDVRRANTDRFGDCSLDLTPEQQRVRWGVVRFAPGRFPPAHEVYQAGSAEHLHAREQARQAAWGLPDDQRAEALAAVTTRFGASPVTSKTLKEYGR